MEEKNQNKKKELLKEFFLTTVSLNNSATVYVLTALIVLFGLISYVSLPKENFPEVSIPTIYIGTVYPGNSPADMENLVTRQIERYVKAEKGVDKIKSTSLDGYSAVTVEFKTDVPVREARLRVKNAVDKAKADLPHDLPADPDVQELDFGELPVLNVSFAGPYTKDQLRAYAKILKEEVERVPEISKGEIKGVDDREVHINVDPYKMEARQINFGDIESAIQAEHMNMSAGDIISDGIRRSIRLLGEYENPLAMAHVIVKREGGVPVYLRDIATVDYTYVDQESFSKVNYKNVVTLDIIKRSGRNMLIATAKVREILADLRQGELPDDLEMVVTGDQSSMTKEQIASLENNIISGVILVVLVLLFFLNTRNALFVGMAIPLSMLMSFMVLGILGITINMMVLFSLIMALGMLVDNGIVVVENVYRLMEEGMPAKEATRRGVGEVAWPIIASTATTLAAFLPLAMWPGIMGEFMKYMPITLMITLSCSLFVALVVNPVFIMHFMKVERGQPAVNHRKILRTAAAFILVGALLLLPTIGSDKMLALRVAGNLIGFFGALILLDVYLLTPLSRKFQAHLLPVLERMYANTLVFALGGRRPHAFFAGTFGLFVFSVMLFAIAPPKVLFFPETIPAQAHVFIEYPIGTDINKTIGLTEEIERRVAGVLAGYKDIVKSVVTSSGIGSGDPQVEFMGTGATPHKGRIIVDFVEYKHRNGKSTQEVVNRLRQAVKGYVGVNITANKNADGPPAGKQIQIEVSGKEFGPLIDISDRIIAQVNNAKIPGIEKLLSDLEVGKPEYLVRVDREKARMYGLSTGQIASELRTSLFGKKIATFKDDIDDWDIKLRLDGNHRHDAEALKNRTITYRNNKGKIVQVPIAAVADFELSSTFGSVKRIDQKRVVSITSNVLDGFNPTEVNDEIRAQLADFQLPYGYKVNFGGEQQKQAEEMSFLTTALLLAIFLIFLIIVTQFNQVTAPFIILTSVLFSTIGVFLGLFLFNMDFIVIMTMLGIISLAGIVVNNAIVLLDYANLLKERRRAQLAEGQALTIDMVREVAVQAGKTRLRPVLLTAITTVLGLIPLAIGLNIDFLHYLKQWDWGFYVGGDNVQFWGPMSWTIIFGLTFSTFLTLVIVPVMYLLVERAKVRFGIEL